MCLKIDVYLWEKKRPGQTPPPPPNVHGTFLVTKSICESSLNIWCIAFICSIVWVWWLPNDISILQSVQSPHWKTVLVVETTKLFISNSVGVYTDTFIDTLSQGWGFWLPLNFVPRWGFLCTRIIPGERFLLPSSRAQGLFGGGGGGGWMILLPVYAIVM